MQSTTLETRPNDIEERRRIARRKWREKNKQRANESTREWQQANRDKIVECRRKRIAEDAEYAAKISERQRRYRKSRFNSDELFRIACTLRSRFQQAIKNNHKTGSAVADLGCSIEELKTYLESRFQSGMTWDNWSRTGWHIDHVVPLDSFDLSNPEELKRACHYTNLQPLWAKDNLRKSNKI